MLIYKIIARFTPPLTIGVRQFYWLKKYLFYLNSKGLAALLAEVFAHEKAAILILGIIDLPCPAFSLRLKPAGLFIFCIAKKTKQKTLVLLPEGMPMAKLVPLKQYQNKPPPPV